MSDGKIDIRALIEAGEIDRVVSIVDAVFRDRDRAERLVDAHMLTIQRLLSEGKTIGPTAARIASDKGYPDFLEAAERARRELTDAVKGSKWHL